MGIVDGEIPDSVGIYSGWLILAKYWSFDFDAEITKRYLEDVVKQVVNGHENDGVSFDLPIASATRSPWCTESSYGVY